MEQEIKETLHVIVGMIEELGKKVDNLEKRVIGIEDRLDRIEDRLGKVETEMQGMKAEQERMNEKLDVLSFAYGRHELAIQLLEKKKII